jgi:hypothetical protein
MCNVFSDQFFLSKYVLFEWGYDHILEREIYTSIQMKMNCVHFLRKILYVSLRWHECKELLLCAGKWDKMADTPTINHFSSCSSDMNLENARNFSLVFPNN